MPASADILIQTPDLEAAASFYERHLGLHPTHLGNSLIGLNAGPITLYLDRGPSYGPVLEFFVEDLAHTRDSLIAAGCTVDQEDPAIPRCYIRDPFGLIFNLAERDLS